MTRRINIDLDHVVADFNTHYLNVTGKLWDNDTPARERWGPLIGKEEFFFLNIPAYAGAVEFIQRITELVSEHKLEAQFLTAIPSLHPFPTAHAEKIIWCKRELGSDFTCQIGPYAVDKQKHCRPDDILIDDNPLNIAQWRAAGGIGILHTDNYAATLQTLMSVLTGD